MDTSIISETFLSGKFIDNIVTPIQGSNGNDNILGSNGNDTIFGNNGSDTLIGNDGDDTLFGGDGRDTLDGSDGNDVLAVGSTWEVLLTLTNINASELSADAFVLV